MKTALKTRIFCCFLVLLTVFCSFPVSASSETEKSFSANNPAVAYCIDTKQILYQNREGETFAPGVLTKLMALMVASDLLESTGREMSEKIVIKGEWVQNTYIPGDRSTPYLGLRDGDECTLEYLFASSLVANANDACAALVHYCAEELMASGTEKFLERMNSKAAELGLTDTVFADTIGLGGLGKITARDAALLAAAFYPYNDLVTLSDCYSYGSLKNKNYLKCDYIMSGYVLEGAIGLIAGHATNDGNYTVVTFCEKEGIAYAFVVLGASRERQEEDGTRWFDAGNAYEDMHGMIPHVRDSFGFVQLCTDSDLIAEIRLGNGAEKDFLILVPAESIEQMVSNPDSVPITTQITYDTEKVYESEFNGKTVMTVDAPVKQGDVLGSVSFLLNGKTLATADLVARDSVEVNTLKNAVEHARIFLFEGPMGNIIKIIFWVILGWIILSLLIGLVKLILWIRKKKKESNVNKL